MRSTSRFLLPALIALSTLATAPAHAALKPGDAAPDFSADAALAGEPYRFQLAEALKKGPVVLYFYPKAFTSGCTVEAHQFAEATPKFQQLGVTVIGISNDDLATLKRFSIEACRKQFAVAADAGAKVMKAYDAKLLMMADTADRISYFILPNGRIGAVHAKMSADGHVEAMMKAAEAWKAAR